MTAWARAGRTAASPSRLARSAPPLRGCGLDRLSPARRRLAKRSRFEMSASARFTMALPGGESVLWDGDRLFSPKPTRAMLTGCLIRVSAWVSCPTTFTSRRSLGPALAGGRSMISRLGPSRTIGPSACRLRRPRLTCSKHGSAISSTSCSGLADDLSGALP